MEVQFTDQIEQLKLGAGATFHGEGILAITKALLQSGVAYIGGYQGAPVSHLLDVMVQAKPYVDTLGVHVEACSNEASAAAMLGASIHYPLRGAVTWKSIVGTNVAADALSNLASPGVVGGALIVVGEDYGEGASVIQERTHAYALKSTLALFDPRPDLANMVRLVEHAFCLSEASNMPAVMELRIRACHVRGTFVAKDNVAPRFSTRELIAEPAAFDYMRLAHPPVTFRHEKLKISQRLPAAQAYIAQHGLNERFDGSRSDVGLIVQGGLYNATIRALQQCGLADAFGTSELPLLVLNVTYPLVPEEVSGFCAGKRGVLVVEEGTPEYIEKDLAQALRRLDVQTPVHGKDMLPAAGEYTVEVIAQGLIAFADKHLPGVDLSAARAWLAGNAARRADVERTLGPLPARPPSFCVGCPERPVFAALKLAQAAVGPVHVAADIGCHALATFEPFSSGHSILGYGMSLASRAGVSPMLQRRTLAIMGDGGFWHNGLLTGVQSALFSGDDAVLMIMKNGYTSATGTQDILNTPDDEAKAQAQRDASLHQSLAHKNQVIETTLKGMGVTWMRTVHTYDVDAMRRTLQEAFTSPFNGLKVIIAEGECQLERQRRIRPWTAARLQRGERVERVKYGVDEDVCTGDHACIRLSGCPTLTLKDNPDPLRVDPVATVIDGCVGCGLCGANAHAATLCPSFYRAEVVRNPPWAELLVARLREAVTAWLRPVGLPTSALSPQPSPPRIVEREPHSHPLPLAGEGRGEGEPGRPITILVAALGGEGGGVLSEWLYEAAVRAGHSAQSTSIPGVAQRTGATTYYVEIHPEPDSALARRRPVFSLNPVPGAIDLLASSELLETVRQVGTGMADAARTLIVSSTARALTVAEKMQMGDGRSDTAALLATLGRHARGVELLDMPRLAHESEAAISAVLFGAIAASGVLPFARSIFEETIRAGGKGVQSSLRGFALAFDAVAQRRAQQALVDAALAPPDLREIALPRLRDYQDDAYAQLYEARIERIAAPERDSGAPAAKPGATVQEVTRWLALWMMFDDIVHVASLKLSSKRMERVKREVSARDDEIVKVYDHFKPGVPEFAALLPASLATRLQAWDSKRVARGLDPWALPLRVGAHTVLGALALKLLAALNGQRRRGQRFAVEQALIERWLAAVERGAREDATLGHEIAASGRLIKGYGSTNERGKENLLHIVDHLAFGGNATAQARALAVRQAREAALADDTGRTLDRTLAAHGAPIRAPREQALRFFKRRPAA